MTRILSFGLLVGLIAAVAPAQSYAAPIKVGLELALLVDVSGSVDGNEFNLQKTGYVNAFNSKAIQALIANTPGGIAVSYSYWSGAGQQEATVGWTHLTNAKQATDFATAINTASRPFSGLTAPGSAINWIMNSATEETFASNNFISDRQVIDVSGDGSRNDGANTAAARDAALLAGIDAINGLPILGSEAGLLAWYQNNIQGGAGSFTIAADSFEDFDAAIQLKLFREISPVDPETVVPEPATMAVFGFGALVVGGVYRRNRKATA